MCPIHSHYPHSRPVTPSSRHNSMSSSTSRRGAASAKYDRHRSRSYDEKHRPSFDEDHPNGHTTYERRHRSSYDEKRKSSCGNHRHRRKDGYHSDYDLHEHRQRRSSSYDPKYERQHRSSYDILTYEQDAKSKTMKRPVRNGSTGSIARRKSNYANENFKNDKNDAQYYADGQPVANGAYQPDGQYPSDPYQPSTSNGQFRHFTSDGQYRRGSAPYEQNSAYDESFDLRNNVAYFHDRVYVQDPKQTYPHAAARTYNKDYPQDNAYCQDQTHHHNGTFAQGGHPGHSGHPYMADGSFQAMYGVDGAFNRNVYDGYDRDIPSQLSSAYDPQQPSSPSYANEERESPPYMTPISMAPNFAATPLKVPNISPLMAPPMFDAPLPPAPPPPPAQNNQNVAASSDDSHDYDDVTDDLSVLQIEVEKPQRTLLQNMFCLPLH